MKFKEKGAPGPSAQPEHQHRDTKPPRPRLAAICLCTAYELRMFFVFLNGEINKKNNISWHIKLSETQMSQSISKVLWAHSYIHTFTPGRRPPVAVAAELGTRVRDCRASLSLEIWYLTLCRVKVKGRGPIGMQLPSHLPPTPRQPL